MKKTLRSNFFVYTLILYLCILIQNENTQWDTSFILQLCNYVIKASFRWRKTNASRWEFPWCCLAVKYLLDCSNKHKVFGVYFALKSFLRDINEKIYHTFFIHWYTLDVPYVTVYHLRLECQKIFLAFWHKLELLWKWN